MPSAAFVANAEILTINKDVVFINSKEISELAAWAAKNIKEILITGGRKLDDAGEDIIREYVQTELKNWQLGEKITLENSSRLVDEILSRRQHETETLDEVMNALFLISAKFPGFVEENLRQREAEARILAAKMPAVKV